MDNDAQEPPRKKKKSNKSKKSKNKSPSHTAEEGSTGATGYIASSVTEDSTASHLPGAAECITDNDLDLSHLLTDRQAQDSGDDCVLPTVPSLADMFQSDICSSIASAESSLDDAETPSPTTDQQPELCVKQEPMRISDQSMALSISTDLDNPPLPSSDNQPQAPSSEETADVKPPKPITPSGCSVNPPLPPEPEPAPPPIEDLTTHAHNLLDSTSGLSLSSAPTDSLSSSTLGTSSSSTGADTGTDTTKGSGAENKENAEGYQLMTRHLVKDIIPKLQFEELPEGWKELVHETGLPVYCHLATRVVTWSRPYSLLDRYAKTHDVPVGAIPCMMYKRCKEAKEKVSVANQNADSTQSSTNQNTENLKAPQSHKNSQSASQNNSQSSNPDSTEQKSTDTSHSIQAMQTNGAVSSSTEIKTESVQNDIDDESTKKFANLTCDNMIDYCKPIFIFEKMEFKKFSSWKVRKEHEKKIKHQKAKTENADQLKVIIPVTDLPEADQKDDRGKLKRDFIVIPSTRTVMDVYSAFVNWGWKKVPQMEVKIAQDGYECKLKVKGQEVMYGYGNGPTKKSAKERAAAEAIRNLIPKHAQMILANVITFDREKSDYEAGLEEYYKIFDQMAIKDERVIEITKTTNQLYPIVLLKACIRRNFAMGDDAIKVETSQIKSKYASILCDMSVGSFSAKAVKGKNTKIATNLAAQDIIQQLHPHLSTWGSILRLYGKFAKGSTYEAHFDNGTDSDSTECSDMVMYTCSKCREQSSYNVEDIHRVVTETIQRVTDVIHSEHERYAQEEESQLSVFPLIKSEQEDTVDEPCIRSQTDISGYIDETLPFVKREPTTPSMPTASAAVKEEAVEDIAIQSESGHSDERMLVADYVSPKAEPRKILFDSVGVQCQLQLEEESADMKEEPSDYKQLLTDSEEPLDHRQTLTASVKRKLSETEHIEQSVSNKRSGLSADGGPLSAVSGGEESNTTSTIREQRSIHSQTEVGGRDAFYSHKNLKPLIILEEGVKAQDTYTSIQGSYILLSESGCQTMSVGHSTYHKATQMPEMSYNPYTNKNVVVKRPAGSPLEANLKPEPELSVPEVNSFTAVNAFCQTENAYTQLHKATQYPDKDYIDPGHPPAPAPPIYWNDQQTQQQQQIQLQMQQQAVFQQQQQQQQQLLLQQQLAMQQAAAQQQAAAVQAQQQQLQSQYYSYIDPTTGLPIVSAQQSQYLQFFPGYDQ